MCPTRSRPAPDAPAPAGKTSIKRKRLVLGAWAGADENSGSPPQHGIGRFAASGASHRSGAAAVAPSPGSWASEAANAATNATGEDVNLLPDPKGPLTGKGPSLVRWRDDANTRLQRLHAEMEQLSAQSRSIAERSFGLMVYALRHGRQLRWRMTSGRHATWERILPLLASQPAGLARWYRTAQDQALILNHREQVLRYEVRTVERLMELGQPRQPRSYMASVGRGAGGGRGRGPR